MSITIPAWKVTLGHVILTDNGEFTVTALSQRGYDITLISGTEDITFSAEDAVTVIR